MREQYLATGKDVLQRYETVDIKPTCSRALINRRAEVGGCCWRTSAPREELHVHAKTGVIKGTVEGSSLPLGSSVYIS